MKKRRKQTKKKSVSKEIPVIQAIGQDLSPDLPPARIPAGLYGQPPILEVRKAIKAACSHINPYSGKPSVDWMQHSHGEILGVCRRCGSRMDARKPEDAKFLTTQAMNFMGKARIVFEPYQTPKLSFWQKIKKKIRDKFYPVECY